MISFSHLAAGHEAGQLHVRVGRAHLHDHLLEAVEAGLGVVDIVLVYLVGNEEEMLLVGKPDQSEKSIENIDQSELT